MPQAEDVPTVPSGPPLIVIAAMTADRVIGRDEALPWSLPEEYAHFLTCIRGHTVLMGRRSWEIFGGDLTSRFNIVVSRTAGELPGAVVTRSIDDALGVAADLGRTVFSAGGAAVYAATLPRAHALWLSIVHNRHAGDTYFPAVDADAWREVRRQPHDGWDFVVSHRRSAYERDATISVTGE